MKKFSLLMLAAFSILSCNREDVAFKSDDTNLSSKVDGRGGSSNNMFASYSPYMEYSRSISCNGSYYPIQIIIDPNLPIISKPIAVNGYEPFLDYVRINYGVLNREVANVIFNVYNTPNVQQYSSQGNGYSEYVSSYYDPRKQLHEIEVAFGQDGDNASLYGDIFPYDKFMNQDVVNTLSHNIVHQIQQNTQNSNIDIKAILTYRDALLCIPPYSFLKVRIAYTNN